MGGWALLGHDPGNRSSRMLPAHQGGRKGLDEQATSCSVAVALNIEQGGAGNLALAKVAGDVGKAQARGLLRFEETFGASSEPLLNPRWTYLVASHVFLVSFAEYSHQACRDGCRSPHPQ